MTEIKVSIVISADVISESEVCDALIELCESKEWEMGGGVEEIKPIDAAKKELK